MSPILHATVSIIVFLGIVGLGWNAVNLGLSITRDALERRKEGQ